MNLPYAPAGILETDEYLNGISVVVASMAVGAVIGHGLNAQGAKPAFEVITQSTPDEAKFATLLQRFGEEVQKVGGKYLARGKPVQVVDGQALDRVTIIEFKNVDDAKKYYTSPGMKQLLEDRKPLVKNSQIVVVEGQ